HLIAQPRFDQHTRQQPQVRPVAFHGLVPCFGRLAHERPSWFKRKRAAISARAAAKRLNFNRPWSQAKRLAHAKSDLSTTPRDVRSAGRVRSDLIPLGLKAESRRPDPGQAFLG